MQIQAKVLLQISLLITLEYQIGFFAKQYDNQWRRID